jgi:hypothetical protein
MERLLFALAAHAETPGPLDPGVALVSFLVSLALTALIGWWAGRLADDRERRRIAVVAAMAPAPGIH